MRAAVLHNLNEPLDVTDVEIDEPHAGEVRVRMQASSVCHSDLSVIEGVIPFMMPMVAGSRWQSTAGATSRLRRLMK